MVNNKTGTMVATIRAFKGISQTELARDSAVPNSYISTFENGKRILSDKHLAMLEEALGVRFDVVRPAFEQFAEAVTNAAAPEPAP